MSLQQRIFLGLCVWSILGDPSIGILRAEEPLNIVILYADDWRHDTLGCAGNPVVQTPQIDALAHNGVRFTHNCASTSVCWVSRASFLTGQWMSRHGNTKADALRVEWSQTFPGLLRQNGYYVGHVGKWHNGQFPRANFDFGRSYSWKHWMDQPDGSKIHVTEKNELDALDFLRQRPQDRPFCLTVAFFATHAEDANPQQFLPQPESMELYRDTLIPVPVTATPEHFRRLPPFLANEKNEGRNRWHWRFDTPERYQEMMKNYYRMATEVDTVCGRLVDELKDQGILDKTLVIFTTDNGYFHGEHQLADKWYPYEESLRIPLVILDPRTPAHRKGSLSDEFTLNVDLAPTILAAAGIPPGADMQGRDLSVLYREENVPDWRKDFFYEHPTVRNKDFIPASESLVTKEWKYLFWPEFDFEELFDLRNDPLEERNLAQSPEASAKLHSMRTRFAEVKKQAAGH